MRIKKIIKGKVVLKYNGTRGIHSTGLEKINFVKAYKKDYTLRVNFKNHGKPWWPFVSGVDFMDYELHKAFVKYARENHIIVIDYIPTTSKQRVAVDPGPDFVLYSFSNEKEYQECLSMFTYGDARRMMQSPIVRRFLTSKEITLKKPILLGPGDTTSELFKNFKKQITDTALIDDKKEGNNKEPKQNFFLIYLFFSFQVSFYFLGLFLILFGFTLLPEGPKKTKLLLTLCGSASF
jgi:hypothetical protein